MKYIKNISKICLSGFLTMLLIGCSTDFLDRQPLGSLDEDTYLTTEDAGFKLLVNCYIPITDDWNYQTMKFDLGNQLTDDSAKGGSDAGDRSTITEAARGNPMATNELFTNLWNHRYRSAITPCNVFLDLVQVETPLIQSGGALVSEETKKRWIAETHFMRAFYYFDLAVIFVNVPTIDKPLTAIDKNTITRASKEDVRDFILADLDFAIKEANLPSAINIPLSETGRITKEAAIAFRARVNMFYGNYEAAKSDLKAVYDSGCYDLVNNYEDLFNKDDAKGYLSKESVFVTLRNYIPNFTGGSVCPQMNIGRGVTGGWGGECPTFSLAKEYEKGDPRLVHTIISSGDVFLKNDGIYEYHDYSGYDNFTLQHNRKQYPDWSRRPDGDLYHTTWTFYHIRYADVLLMYAECLIETNSDKQLAVDLINRVRYRAFVTSTHTDSYAHFRKFNVTNADKVDEIKFNSNYKVELSDDLRAAVRHERRVELGGEGLRLYDLLRWGTFVSTMKIFYQSAEGKYSGAGQNISENTWPYPIPQNEIDYVGGSLIQNDNYR